MSIKKASILSAVSIAFCPIVSYAQEVTPNYREADVRQLIEAVGKITGTTVVIEEDVEGRVTFQSAAPMSLPQLRSAMIAHLLDLGYEVTDRDGVLRIGAREP